MRLKYPSWSAAALIVTAFIGFGGVAHAGDTACLWNAMPKAQRDSVIDSFARQLPDTSLQITEQPDGGAAIFNACHIPKARWAAAGQALMLYAGERGLAAHLLNAYGVSEADIAKAWNAIPQADRDHLQTLARTVGRAGDDVSFIQDVTGRVAALIGKPLPEDGLIYLAIYLAEGALRREAEAEF